MTSQARRTKCPHCDAENAGLLLATLCVSCGGSLATEVAATSLLGRPPPGSQSSGIPPPARPPPSAVKTVEAVEVAGQRSKRRCPRCRKTMARAEYGSVDLDVCGRCGVWFDARELGQLRRTHAQALSLLERKLAPRQSKQVTSPHAPACPACHTPLTQFAFKQAPGVELDGCSTCKGVWVDRGALKRLETEINPPLAPRAPPRPGPTLREDPPAKGPSFQDGSPRSSVSAYWLS